MNKPRAFLILLALLVFAASAAAPAPASAARGSVSDWVWLGGDAAHTIRWDPCTAVTWSTPHDGSVTEKAFARAVRKVARFSGYTFQRVESGGMVTTDVVDTNDPVWSGPLATAGAFADIHGAGRPGPELWANDARIVIRSSTMAPVYVHSLPTLFLHELGHVVGLGHAASNDQVMYSGGFRNRYGAGDRAGLAAVNPLTCAPVLGSYRGVAAHPSRVRVS